jgi:hypothetical protein
LLAALDLSQAADAGEGGKLVARKSKGADAAAEKAGRKRAREEGVEGEAVQGSQKQQRSRRLQAGEAVWVVVTAVSSATCVDVAVEDKPKLTGHIHITEVGAGWRLGCLALETWLFGQ